MGKEYVEKIAKIKENGGEAEIFSAAEITAEIADLAAAEQSLTLAEYDNVKAVYEYFGAQKEKLSLDYDGFISKRNEIIAHFDLAAPYHKFCKEEGHKIAEVLDGAKIKYRKKAASLIKKGKLFGEEWTALCKRFAEEFYI